jgi:hypothetical protein
MPWQQFLLREACARRDGRWRYRTSLALVARQNGKTLLTAIRILGGMMLFGEGLIIATAQTRAIALETWRLIIDLAEAADLPLTRIVRQSGLEELQINGCRYRVLPNTSNAARGFAGVDLVVMDEVRAYLNWEAYSSMEKTRRAKSGSQLWAITTEGDSRSAVLNRLQEDARDALVMDEDRPVGYFEWSAPKNAEPSDPRTWAMANPALGYTITHDVILDEYKSDPAPIFETEVLCRKVRTLDTWIDLGDWDTCADTTERFPTDVPYVFALDAGPELRHVTIVAGATAHNRTHLEAISAAAGPHCLETAETRLNGLLSKWRPKALVVLARSPVEPLAQRLGAKHNIPVQPVDATGWKRACRAFYEAVRRKGLIHPGGPLIASHLKATRRGSDGLVTDIHRANSQVENDAALAAVLAVWGSTQLPTEEARPSWVAF